MPRAQGGKRSTCADRRHATASPVLCRSDAPHRRRRHQQQAPAASATALPGVFPVQHRDPAFPLHDTGEIIDVINPPRAAYLATAVNELHASQPALIDVTQENTRKATQARIRARSLSRAQTNTGKGWQPFHRRCLARSSPTPMAKTAGQRAIRDITEQLRQEEEIRQLNTRLEGASAPAPPSWNRRIANWRRSAIDRTRPDHAAARGQRLQRTGRGIRRPTWTRRSASLSATHARSWGLVHVAPDRRVAGAGAYARQPLQRSSVDLRPVGAGAAGAIAAGTAAARRDCRYPAGLQLQADPALLHEPLRQLRWRMPEILARRRAGAHRRYRDDSRQPPAYFVRDNGIGF